MKDYRKSYYYNELKKVSKEELIRRLIVMNEVSADEARAVKNEFENTENEEMKNVINRRRIESRTISFLINSLFDDEAFTMDTERIWSVE